MKTTIISLVPVLAGLCQAFKIDMTGYGDGVWGVEYDNDGNAIGEPKLLAPVNATSFRMASRERRDMAERDLPSPQVNCGSHGINSGDFDCAQSAFKQYLDQGIYYPKNYYVRTTCGSAQAYMCTYSQQSRGWSGEYSDANGLLNIACSSTKSGWVYIHDYDKSYGKDGSGIGEC